ncbi:MAG: alanine--tRNA ligase [Spirochaetaceae bacterium]|nr:alanine--tRNA ligase [Spirochaetaceae bacterium]
MITYKQLRDMYIQFFKSKQHAEISGKSLVPENDPTVLFTTAGMHPLVPYLLGEVHPEGKRLTDYQKCFRTADIDEVGDASHLTFFEMLGNWSLGDYFKEESIAWSFEFLTSPQYLHIPIEKLFVTVFEGDEIVAKDEESAHIWKKLGIAHDRIYFLPRSDNWWGPAGETGPCGPDTEIFIDTGKEKCSPTCKPGCHCGKYVEIWNNVFMQYEKTKDGSFIPLSRKCVDTGMGVERTVAMLNGFKSVYDIDIFQEILKGISQFSNTAYGKDAVLDTSMRIIADHLRASCFILGDPKSVLPSNLGAGYVLRRLIRRTIRHCKKLNINEQDLLHIASIIIEQNRDLYPELLEKKEHILKELNTEQNKFFETLRKGEQEYEKLLPNLLKNPNKIIPGRLAFRLYDTYGFPFELTEELACESGLTVDKQGFDEAFKKHQELSRAGSEQTFKGGLADHSEATTAYHTATHLLHKALRLVLGEHVEQRGSNITAERLRFDFTHFQPMTDEQKKEVERIVNEQIAAHLPVTMETMPLEDAKKAGAMALFGEKYESIVKVYRIGDFSLEVCGGPHVTNTESLGHFRIAKEQSSSAGVRRIRAVLE